MKSAVVNRMGKLRELMVEERLDAFLVAVPENRYYLSGYQAEDMNLVESSGYLLISQSRQLLLTDFRYQEEAGQDAPEFELVVYREGLRQVLPELLRDLQVKRLGVEGHYCTHSLYLDVEEALKEVFPGAVTLSVEGLVERLRVIKEPEEMDRIRDSLALTEKTLDAVWHMLKPGLTEKEVAWKIEVLIREGGGQGVSFPPIVASGPNAALPHAVPTDRKIQAQDPVILDLGSKLRHYCSDMTRTWTAGAPQEKLRAIYHIVREAQLAAQQLIRPGVDAGEVDAAARSVIEQAGYGDYFGHGLGHGVGLAVHEQPRLRKKKGRLLAENMVVTVEPGIYVPGFGGVRLENMVRVTHTGCEVLNHLDLFYPWQSS
ncbi:M24 family metallopeptidase [Desulfoferrobacter suflitae]|uniref:M24 family metallopeptidase n=1 Tax=Desulfoferrobacter suflitae TaxID=2865782 RepID=UPI002164042A|nr:Xaa-Pro peptidase family protein [Desulfoferrobacter suflitae]MCK8600601.1 Xaa-Pro peptidase family protein [Desulfoferrobacter suflitae]